MAELKSEIASLKEQMDVVVSYLRDHQSGLIVQECLAKQLELAVQDHQSRLLVHEHRLKIIDKVLGPLVESVRFVRRRWRTLSRR